LINEGKRWTRYFTEVNYLSFHAHSILYCSRWHSTSLISKTAADSPIEMQYLDENIPILIKQIDNFRTSGR
ncbi:hypothetical protein, partial [Sphingobacterium thalpophilum]|uniref:hypothetical protein n=1 Tax=Sphingobacterium thalpophilum TaxID=259 RepID=UPI0031D2F2E3